MKFLICRLKIKNMRKKIYFKKGEIFHIFNKSIANYGIFKDPNNSFRFLQTLVYYNSLSTKINLGTFLKTNPRFEPNIFFLKFDSIVKFISYCIMTDHYHLLVKILADDVFPKYISDVENSFSRFFNVKFNRKGPLWQTSFKAVKVKTNEQLLHLSRYIHLNPTTAGLVDNPEDWPFSSYKKIITDPSLLAKFLPEISIANPLSYKKFVEDRKDYQKKLKLIKKLLFD